MITHCCGNSWDLESDRPKLEPISPTYYLGNLKQFTWAFFFFFFFCQSPYILITRFTHLTEFLED